MRMLCVARHRFLSEHLCRYFDGLGMDTVPCVGLRQAKSAMAATTELDVVICDYDLLATTSADRVGVRPGGVGGPGRRGEPDAASGRRAWARRERHRRTSSTCRRSSPEDAHRVFAGVRRTRGITPPNVLPWPGHDAGATAALTRGGRRRSRRFPPRRSIDALRATGGDGAPRRVVLSDGGGHSVEAEVCRARDGRLFIALGHGGADEFEPLRDLARQMAGVVDTAEILGILCDAAVVQSDASGAARAQGRAQRRRGRRPPAARSPSRRDTASRSPARSRAR